LILIICKLGILPWYRYYFRDSPSFLLLSSFFNHRTYSEDISANMNALEKLHTEFNTQLLLIESGGDNLAGTFIYYIFLILFYYL